MSATSTWGWPMWIACAVWRARLKAQWEHVSVSAAARWMRGWTPTATDVEMFLDDVRRWDDRRMAIRLNARRLQWD